MIQIRLDITEPNAQYRDHLTSFIDELYSDCLAQGFILTRDKIAETVVNLKILLDHLNDVDMDYRITGPDLGIPCHLHSLFVTSLSRYKFPGQYNFNELIRLYTSTVDYPEHCAFTVHHNTLNITSPF